jgi:hypothetical protein
MSPCSIDTTSPISLTKSEPAEVSAACSKGSVIQSNRITVAARAEKQALRQSGA